MLSDTVVLSYQPREPMLPSSKFSWNSSVPLPGGGGSVTVIVELPDLPELVAVIVADPAATPDTTPELTVATPVLLDDHVTLWPDIVLPF